MPKKRTFSGIFGPITGREALEKYPNPAFFMRGDLRMSHDELRGLIHRNADEVIHQAGMIRLITGPVQGRITKKTLLFNANLLHDMRMLVNTHGGEAGRPYLWEV